MNLLACIKTPSHWFPKGPWTLPEECQTGAGGDLSRNPNPREVPTSPACNKTMTLEALQVFRLNLKHELTMFFGEHHIAQIATLGINQVE